MLPGKWVPLVAASDTLGKGGDVSRELEASSKALTELLNRVADGGNAAFSRLVELAYDDLHRVAAARLRARYGDRAAHMTISPTALTNDVVMRLREQRSAMQNTQHFFAIATRLMLQLIMDEARGRLAQKRGGGQRPQPLEEQDRADQTGFGRAEVEPGQFAKLIAALHDADPRAAEVAVLHVFCGHALEAIAVALDLSLATVKRDWRSARAWLTVHGGQSGHE